MSNKTFGYFIIDALLIAAGLILALGFPGVLISAGLVLIVIAQSRYTNLVQFGDEDV